MSALNDIIGICKVLHAEEVAKSSGCISKNSLLISAAETEIEEYKAVIAKLTAENAALRAALEVAVMFLTNANTICEERQRELVAHLKNGGLDDLADAVAIGGFAAMMDGDE